MKSPSVIGAVVIIVATLAAGVVIDLASNAISDRLKDYRGNLFFWTALLGFTVFVLHPRLRNWLRKFDANSLGADPQRAGRPAQYSVGEQLEELARRVHDKWVAGSLHLTLGESMEARLGKLDPPLAFIGSRGDIQPLGSNPELRQWFENTSRRALIISGEGGAGKSTLLLRVVQILLETRTQDRTAVPIVLNVSTWVDPALPEDQQASFSQWIERQLLVQYGITPATSRQFVENQSLIYCLDGFDEISDDHRSADESIHANETDTLPSARLLRERFAGQLTSFVDDQQASAGLIITTRSELVDELRETDCFRGEIRVQPLSPSEVAHSLKESRFDTLYGLAIEYPYISRLLQVPQHLHVFATVYPPTEQESNSADIRGANERLMEARNAERFLRTTYDDYLTRKTIEVVDSQSRRRPSVVLAKLWRAIQRPFSVQDARHYVAELANYLQNRRQNVFRLDEIQPALLAEAWKGRYRIVLSLYFAMAIFVLAGLPVGLAIAVEFLAKHAPDMAAWHGTLAAASIGLVGGGLVGLGFWLSSGVLQRRILDRVREPALHKHNRQRAGLLLGFFIGTALALSRGLVLGLAAEVPGSAPGLPAALFHVVVGMIFFVPLFIAVMRAIADDPWWIEPIELWEQHTRQVWWFLALAGILSITLGWISGVARGIAFGVTIALPLAFRFGRRPRTTPLRMRPNQGIQYSFEHAAWHAFRLTAASSVTFGLVFGAFHDWQQALSNALLAGACLVTFLIFGGTAVLEHAAVRTTLASYKVAPLDYVYFLDLACDAGVLRKSGGAFRFPNEEFVTHYQRASQKGDWGRLPKPSPTS